MPADAARGRDADANARPDARRHRERSSGGAGVRGQRVCVHRRRRAGALWRDERGRNGAAQPAPRHVFGPRHATSGNAPSRRTSLGRSCRRRRYDRRAARSTLDDQRDDPRRGRHDGDRSGYMCQSSEHHRGADMRAERSAGRIRDRCRRRYLQGRRDGTARRQAHPPVGPWPSFKRRGRHHRRPDDRRSCLRYDVGEGRASHGRCPRTERTDPGRSGVHEDVGRAVAVGLREDEQERLLSGAAGTGPVLPMDRPTRQRAPGRAVVRPRAGRRQHNRHHARPRSFHRRQPRPGAAVPRKSPYDGWRAGRGGPRVRGHSLPDGTHLPADRIRWLIPGDDAF